MRIAPELAGFLFGLQSLRQVFSASGAIFAPVSLAHATPFLGRACRCKGQVKIAKAGQASRAGGTTRSAHLADARRQSRAVDDLRWLPSQDWAPGRREILSC